MAPPSTGGSLVGADGGWQPERSTSARVQTAPGENAEKRWRTAERLSAKDGERHTVYLPGSGNYKGSWKSNLKHGKGTMVYTSKGKYEGEWVRDRREGLGTLWKYLGRGKFRVQYHGSWAADLPDGRGVFYDDGGDRYEGEWRAGLRHGRGRQSYGGRPSDGFGADVYEGQWVDGERSGKGTLTLASGDVYTGHWQHDVKHGQGSYVYLTKGKRYDGTWKDGSPVCGSYSDVAPQGERPVGPNGKVPAALPTLELEDAEAVLAGRRAKLTAGDQE